MISTMVEYRERLEAAMKAAGKSTAEVAAALGVSYQAVRKLLNGSTHAFSAENNAAAARFLNVSSDWLSTGKGPRVGTAEPTPPYGAHSTMQPILAWEYEEDLPPGEFVMVPRLSIRLSAGSGLDQQVHIEFIEAQPQAFRSEWVRERRLRPNKLAAMTASGDSMEPSIHDNDSLLVDTSQTEVQDGKVYALWYDGGERVKRLYRLPGGGLRIKSDNPEYGPIELGPEYHGNVRIIGRVVHRSGTGGL